MLEPWTMMVVKEYSKQKLIKIDDNFYVNNHKNYEKYIMKVLFFFNQQKLQWMLMNIVYNKT